MELEPVTATLEPAPSAPLNYRGPAPERSRKPRVWPAFTFMGVILVYPIGLGVAVGIVLAIYGITQRWTDPQFHAVARDARLLLPLMGLIAAINIALAQLHQLLSRRVKPFLPLFRRPRAGILSIVPLAAGAVALGQVFSCFTYWLQVESPALKSLGKMMSEPAAIPPTLHFILSILIVGILAPIGEEAVFRGAIQGRLTQRYGPLRSILLTSLVFGVYHFDLIQGLFAFGMGLYLGYLAHRTRSILPTIAAHMALNSTSCVLNFTHTHLIGSGMVIPGFLTCALITIGAILLINRLPFLHRPA